MDWGAAFVPDCAKPSGANGGLGCGYTHSTPAFGAARAWDAQGLPLPGGIKKAVGYSSYATDELEGG